MQAISTILRSKKMEVGFTEREGRYSTFVHQVGRAVLSSRFTMESECGGLQKTMRRFNDQ